MSDGSITTIVTGTVTVATLVVGFLTLWLKLRYGVERADSLSRKADSLAAQTGAVKEKLEENTAITKAGAVAATANAKAAAGAAAEAREAAQVLASKLNGGVDVAIEAAVKPLRDALQDHVLAHERDMKEVRTALAALGAKIDENSRRIR